MGDTSGQQKRLPELWPTMTADDQRETIIKLLGPITVATVATAGSRDLDDRLTLDATRFLRTTEDGRRVRYARVERLAVAER